MLDFLKINSPMDRRTFGLALFACFFSVSLLNTGAALVMQKSFDFVWADNAAFQNSLYFKANLALKGLAILPLIGIFFYFPVKRLIHIGISPVLFLAAYFTLSVFDFTYISANWQPARDKKFDAILQKVSDAHNADSPFHKVLGPNDAGFDPNDPNALSKILAFSDLAARTPGKSAPRETRQVSNTYLPLDGSGPKQFAPPKHRVTPIGMGLNFAYLLFLLFVPGGYWKRGGTDGALEPMLDPIDWVRSEDSFAPEVVEVRPRPSASPRSFGKKTGQPSSA